MQSSPASRGSDIHLNTHTTHTHTYVQTYTHTGHKQWPIQDDDVVAERQSACLQTAPSNAYLNSWNSALSIIIRLHTDISHVFTVNRHTFYQLFRYPDTQARTDNGTVDNVWSFVLKAVLEEYNHNS